MKSLTLPDTELKRRQNLRALLDKALEDAAKVEGFFPAMMSDGFNDPEMREDEPSGNSTALLKG